MTKRMKKVVRPALSIGLVITLTVNSGLFASARAAEDTEETIEYYLTDHLGSTDVVLDEDGNVVERRDYLPYGEDRLRITESTAPDTDYGFTGQKLDEETGLYYYGARYYDAALGRFVSADSWEGDLNNPQSLNQYSYTLNNPVKYTDPTGHIPDPTDAIVLPLGPFAPLGLAAKELAEAVVIAGIIKSVANDIKEPNIVTTPAVPKTKPAIVTTPASPRQKQVPLTTPVNTDGQWNISDIPAYTENEARVLSFPDYNDTIGGCGVNMSCAVDDEKIINLPQNPEDAGYKWKGKGKKGVEKGSWHNEKTGEKIYPDRKHGPPQGPHDDYTDPSGKQWRVTPDGKATPK